MMMSTNPLRELYEAGQSVWLDFLRRVRPGSVAGNGPDRAAVLSMLAEDGIDLDAITERLLEEGLAAFDADLANLVASIEARLEDPPAQ